MAFTDFGGSFISLQERLADDSYTELVFSEQATVALDYYQIKPYILTIGNSDPSFAVRFAEPYTNAGVKIVRVK